MAASIKIGPRQNGVIMGGKNVKAKKRGKRTKEKQRETILDLAFFFFYETKKYETRNRKKNIPEFDRRE